MIRTPQGEEYTRNGNFLVGVEGYLMTKNGYPVLGENGPLFLQERYYTINQNGEIYVRPIDRPDVDGFFFRSAENCHV